MKERVKITFLGDIMCEEPFLRAAKRADKIYDFDTAFDGIRQLCSEADLLIANLETPLAGVDKRLTHAMYSFNTPDSFADALKNLGVDCVLTANNHCCDRGIEGLIRTLDVLDSCGLPHTGTYKVESNNKPFTANTGGVKIAVLSCTASTNPISTGLKATTANVNLMQEQITVPADTRFRAKLKRFVGKNILGEKNVCRIKKALGKPPKKAYADTMPVPEQVKPYMNRLCKQIQTAKKEFDLVFVCPHMGGQFNLEPGEFCKYAMEQMVEAGADAIIASHPHVVQKAEMKRCVPCAYSIGNVSMSMSTPYILKDDLPDYGVALHVYITDGRIDEITYSVIVMDEREDGYMLVRTAYDMYRLADSDKQLVILNNVNRIAQRISGNDKELFSDVPEEICLFAKNIIKTEL